MIGGAMGGKQQVSWTGEKEDQEENMGGRKGLGMGRAARRVARDWGEEDQEAVS
jgi:hypothetical protein